MSEWGIINGNPIIFQMGSSPKWDIGHVTVTRHGEHITSFTLHDFVLTLVPRHLLETPRSHHSLLKVQDAPENGYDWERDNVNKKLGCEEIGGWAEILVMILVGVGEKWWDYCIFCLSQQTAWAPAVTEVFSTSRWPVLPTSETGDQKNWAEFELLYIPLSLTVLHRAAKGKS